MSISRYSPGHTTVAGEEERKTRRTVCGEQYGVEN